VYYDITYGLSLGSTEAIRPSEMPFLQRACVEHSKHFPPENRIFTTIDQLINTKMKASSPLQLLWTAAVASATYMCPVSPGSSDAPAIMFGYVVQNLLSTYYDSVPINESFYSSLPSPTKPMTDYLANTKGLAVQAKLGDEALLQAGMAAGGMKPNCSFSYPPVTDATSHLMNAYIFEATMCGAFIGLADYVQSPQAAFLMARLAAEHGE